MESEFGKLKAKDPKKDKDKEKEELLKRAEKKFEEDPEDPEEEETEEKDSKDPEDSEDPEEECDPEKEDCKKKKDIKESISKMKLLVEDAYEMETEILEELNESSTKEKNYYIYGTFSTPDKKNRNGRIYSSKLWEENVNNYQDHIKNNTINSLGEMEHPSRVNPDPMKAVMKITELKMEDNLVKGRAQILNNNSPDTNQIKALIDEGIKIAVSSRGTGRMKGSIVEEFVLSTFDAVNSPSDYNANLTGIRESVEEAVLLTESGYKCTSEGCILEGTGSGDIAQDPECINNLIKEMNIFSREVKDLKESEIKAVILMTEDDLQTATKLIKKMGIDSSDIELKGKAVTVTLKNKDEAQKVFKTMTTLAGQLKDKPVIVKKDNKVTISMNKDIALESEEVDESAVGLVGRSGTVDAENHINQNPDLIKRFKKMIKELGGLTATRQLLNTFDPKLKGIGE